MKPILSLIFVCLVCGSLRADDRIWVDARINRQPARLIFDTGADRLILFREGATRLNLDFADPASDSAVPPGTVRIGSTEPCEIDLWGNTFLAELGVVEMPDYLKMRADGVLGWRAVRNNVLLIDAVASKIRFLPRVPKGAKTWATVPLQTGSDYLSLEVPEPVGATGVVMIDTGFTGGVAIPPARWKQWRTAHPNAPSTMTSYFMPGAGLVVKEEVWAESIQLGGLTLTDVPLIEANQAQINLGSAGYEGSLGLAALKRIDLVVDGKHERAYVRPKTTPALPYEHNRLGAVFVPSNPDSNDLVAHLANGSPAHEAGICNGDVLLRIGALDATKWRSDPQLSPLGRFWMQPPGTRIHLTLKRENGTYDTTVLLRQILGPAGDASLRTAQNS